MQIKHNDKSLGKVTDRGLRYTMTMFPFEWECWDCKQLKQSVLSEEEDMATTDNFVTLTCKKCGANNRILIDDIITREDVKYLEKKKLLNRMLG